MPVAILCGGRGTRLGEHSVPKALVEVGGRPILWHILKLYAAQGFNDFVLCLGFGAGMIEEAFSQEFPKGQRDPSWKIRFEDTGLETNKSGRLLKIRHHLPGAFMATYGDGIARIDLTSLVDHHNSSGRLATITCVKARTHLGLVHVRSDGSVEGFEEKPMLKERINGGFFVFEPQIFDYLTGEVELEAEPFEKLAADNQLTAYIHDDFWACMDTYKETLHLNELWESDPPWKVWDD